MLNRPLHNHLSPLVVRSTDPAVDAELRDIKETTAAAKGSRKG